MSTNYLFLMIMYIAPPADDGETALDQTRKTDQSETISSSLFFHRPGWRFYVCKSFQLPSK
ncbi:unnamed protein product [Brassica oleracea var. botrytis]